MAQFQENAIVTRVEQLSSDNFRISFNSPQIAAEARPGQFVMVRTVVGSDPLLRRPFSVHQTEVDGTVQIYFKNVGRGTQLMSQFSPGEEVSLLGPLGKGFQIDSRYPACLVGGGLGIAPLLFLTRKMASAYLDLSDITVILGGRTSGEVQPLVADFEKYGIDVLVTTDDGSFGEKGFVTDLLRKASLATDCKIFTCGPEAMMAAVYKIALEKGWPCQASVEEEMACGVGACLGCCKTKADGSYTHVCINGPVYNAEELKWNK